MSTGKIIKRTLQTIVLAGVAYAIYFAWQAAPILSGYGAKDLCSCVMIAGRNPDDVVGKELSSFPLSLGTFKVNYEDSSATGSVFGMARQKAIYRKGLGCTVVAEISEEELRAQRFALAPHPLVNQDTVAWPMGNKINDSIPSHINIERLHAVINEAFEESGPKKTRNTRAILVVYDGKIVAEQYAPGFNDHSTQIGWSMTKSITSALVGILVKQGKLDVMSPAPVDAWKNDERGRITLNDLMHASSGLKWEENYSKPSGATNMLYKKKDMGVYAADVPLELEPGKTFYYSSGTSNIISRIVRNTVGDDDYYKFAYRELFYKIGMNNIVVEPDAGGTYVGSSYSFAPARDWARFGLLYLNDGVWNGERILPEGWVKYTTTPAVGAPLGQYGAQFWLNAGAAGNPSQRYYPDVPTDLYWADGFEGQNVFIIPSEKLVVVKLSLSQNGEYLDDNLFLKGIIEAVKK